jgi:2-methylisocitrate lyase-like PEP mutase family enzyme
MTDTSDDALKRLLAQAPQVGADAAFVESIARKVAERRSARRARRVLLVAVLPVLAICLAIVLAPLAPVASLADAGGALLGLPHDVGSAAASAGRMPGAFYLGLALAAVVVPLAGAAWLSRRVG